ncbi:nicotinate-nucleotide--dimethylbenzimidazole phosphoribosyltransferase [Gordonia sp. CPCC 205515]|uniref:nicotinate-nucleotide--dimethylbenzimidazole phosphoribosyltransferase n=1 Tax=Gordonia sp. CPCC 205515 TaxID=3140791 RepID=UPI003AF3614B
MVSGGNTTRTLVLGGVRSGKSSYGESLLADAALVRYVATGPTTSSDTEWVARVAAHRSRRGDRYTTVESTDLAGTLRDDRETPTLVDDLGNWLAAHLDATGGWTAEHVDLSAARDEICAAITAFDGDLVLISPEVGLSVVPPTPAGRRFQDELGALNEAVAAACDRVVLVVAGRVLELPQSAPTATTPTPTAPKAPKAPSITPTATSSPPTATKISPTATTSAPTATTSAPTATTSAPTATTPAATATTSAPTATTSAPTATTPDATAAEVFGLIEGPDLVAESAARERHATLTKPPGSLGRLEEIGIWLAACQGTCPPRQFTQPTVAVFAGDHGVAQGGVSAFPPEVTAQMVANISAGGAAVNVLARRSGATVRVYDMSVDAETSPEVSGYKVRRSSGDLRFTDALTIDEARQALAAGRAIADNLVDGGADLLIVGDMGIGNTTPATVLVGTITRREPVEIVGRGTGIDDAGWIRKTAAIRDGMRRAKRHRHDPLALLATVGGADLTAMAGFLAQAAVRKTPVILDGVVVTAAALVADELAPGAVRWWIAGHRSEEPAHTISLEHLDLTPLVEMSMRLGEGSGALTALPIVASSIDILSSMATFDEAGVSDRDDVAAPAPTGV